MKNSRTVQNVILVAVLVALLVVIRTMLGTHTFMYLSATDIDHVDATGAGVSVTTTGDDTARLVEVLRGAVVYGKTNSEPEQDAAGSTTLAIYNYDGTTMHIAFGNEVIVIDGEAHRTRARDVQAVADWLSALPG